MLPLQHSSFPVDAQVIEAHMDWLVRISNLREGQLTLEFSGVTSSAVISLLNVRAMRKLSADEMQLVTTETRFCEASSSL